MPRVGPFLYRETVPSMRMGAYPFPRDRRGSSLAVCGGGGLVQPRSVGVENSRVVEALRVATACYITVRLTLHSLGFWTPKGLRHAALGCFSPPSTARLLPRTSENCTFFPTHSGE